MREKEEKIDLKLFGLNASIFILGMKTTSS